MSKPREGIVCIDIGFRHTGIAFVEGGGMGLHATGAVISSDRATVTGVRKADIDFAQARYLSAEINDWLETQCPERFKIRGVLVEMPSAGAQGARANRCMGLATGIIAALVERWHLPVEPYLPSDCTGAVLGKKVIPKVAKGVISKGKDKGKPRMVSDKKAAIAASMRKRLVSLLMPDDVAPAKEEHVWDALSTLVAGWNGVIVRSCQWPSDWIKER